MDESNETPEQQPDEIESLIQELKTTRAQKNRKQSDS